MDLGELRRILSQVSIYNPVHRTPPVGLSIFYLESLGTAEVRNFLMAATLRHVVDNNTTTINGRAIIYVLFVREILRLAHYLFFECPYSHLVWQPVASWSCCVSLHLANWEIKHELERLVTSNVGIKREKESYAVNPHPIEHLESTKCSCL